MKTLFIIVFFSILFLYLGINKVLNFEYAAYSIRNYPIYNYFLVTFTNSYHTIIVIIIIEFLSVLVPFFSSLKFSLYLYTGLVVLYFLNILSLILVNTYFDCGCGLYYSSISAKNILLFFSFLLIALILTLSKVTESNSTTLNT
jgi:hypothetical protein